MKRTGLVLATAALALAASTAVATARDMVVTRDSDVYRSATSDRVVNEVERGEVVDVRECSRRANRCLIRIPGQDGWVRSNRLVDFDEWEDDDYDRPGRPGRPGGGGGGGGGSSGGGSGGITITIPFPGFGGGGGGSSGGGGGGSGGGASGGPTNVGESDAPRVCLFEHTGYAGMAQCLRPGVITDLFSLGLESMVSSVRTFGGATVKLCDGLGGAGTCIEISRDTENVGAFNDRAKHARVF
jgi:hypothetical protein